jgi:hypothetical protein
LSPNITLVARAPFRLSSENIVLLLLLLLLLKLDESIEDMMKII